MYITLNISATDIRLLTVKGRRVDKWGNTPLSPGLVTDGLIREPKAVGAAIDALFKSTKVPKEKVITCLTGLSFTYRILSLPRLKSVLLEEAIQRGVRREIPLPIEEMYLSWQAIGGRHDELDYFVLVVPRNLIDTLVQTLAEAGVKPYLMDLKSLALARAANRGNALIVDLEPDCFDIVLVTSGIPTVLHTVSPRRDGASLEDNIQRLTQELLKTVQFHNSNHPENPVSPATPLLLTGALSANATTGRLLQAETGYPTEYLVPPLEFTEDLSGALYAANMGLALKNIPPKRTSRTEASQYHDINLNIRGGKHRTGARIVTVRHIFLALALIIAIGLLFPTYQVKNQANAKTVQLQTDLSRVGQELRQARLIVDEAKQVEDTINKIMADIEAIKEEHQYTLDKSSDLASDLKLVTRTLPPETYFTSIDFNTNQITVKGEAGSTSTVISYATSLEAAKVFSEVRIADIDESNITGTEITRISFTIIIRQPLP